MRGWDDVPTCLEPLLHCCYTLYSVHSQVHVWVQNGCFDSSHHVCGPDNKKRGRKRKRRSFPLRTQPSKLHSLLVVHYPELNHMATSSCREIEKRLAKTDTQPKSRCQASGSASLLNSNTLFRMVIELKEIVPNPRPQKFSGASIKTEGAWKAADTCLTTHSNHSNDHNMMKPPKMVDR